MIDIETKNERDLKNIRQIGMPTQEDKIYIENAVYARIHEEDYAEKKVFVFMGHTECIQGDIQPLSRLQFRFLRWSLCKMRHNGTIARGQMCSAR